VGLTKPAKTRVNSPTPLAKHPNSLKICKKSLHRLGIIDSSLSMIRKRLVQESARQELIALARDASAAHGLARQRIP
jgi:hypothetical protein